MGARTGEAATRTTEKPIPFMKLAGSGNDFIVIDNRQRLVDPRRASRLAEKVCVHRMSVGADGLILIERSRRAHFRWRLFNADGTEAEFSGNGARCAARFAHMKRIAPKRMRFETLAGVVEAELVPASGGERGNEVKIRFPSPSDMRLHLQIPLGETIKEGHFINTGVPHCVYLVDDPDRVDLLEWGRETRYHALFQPAGTNVDFIAVRDPHRIRIRTYERGVEDETLACGTGSIASALIASLVDKADSPVTLWPQSGIPLTVHFSRQGDTFTDVFLQGDARAVSEGRILPEAWQ